MKTTAGSISFEQLPDDYQGLMALFTLRPIHDAVELENATEIVDAMAGHKLSKDQQEFLDILSDLIAKYENEHNLTLRRKSTPLQCLKYLLNEHDMSASDLGRLLGERSLGPKILSGDRDLSKSHIRKLTQHFSISADLLL